MNNLKVLLVSLLLFSFGMARAQHDAFRIQVVGKGNPILLFPGFTCTDAVWSNVVSELSKTNECHLFTFAGFGGVPAIEKPWLPKIKDAVQDYIVQHDLQKASLIGHSLGGTLALWLGTESNFDFQQLIIVDGLPSTGALMIPNFVPGELAYDSPWNHQLLEMDEEAFEQMAQQMAQGMCKNREQQDQIKDWMVQADRETYVYGYTDLLKLDLREKLGGIRSPVLILAATEPYGMEMAKKTYETQYKHLESYDLQFAQGASHFVMYDAPDWLLERIKNNH
jgi:pimeloyl-ACP methyl ester carboxylesterase